MDVNDWLFSASIEVLCVSVYVYLIHVCMSEKRSEGKVGVFFYFCSDTYVRVCINLERFFFFSFFLLAYVYN